MALDLEKIEATQKIFNEKYGVNFKLSEFDGQMRALAENFVISKTPENDWDTQYRANFVKIMHQAFANYVDFKIEEFDPKQMLNDFEDMVMKPYREECKSKNTHGPRKNANWSDKAFYERVQKEFKSLPNSKKEFAKQRYLAGTLRVRDIREHRNKINNQPGFLNSENLSTLMCYKQALEHAVENRSIWFIIRHPFKSNAEKKELKEVTKCISQSTDHAQPAEGERNIFIEANHISNDNTINNLKDSVDKELENVAVDKATEIERLNISEISETNNYKEKSEEIKEINTPTVENTLNF